MLNFVTSVYCVRGQSLVHSRHIGRCQSSATSIFQPPPCRRTTTSSQHARPSGVFRRRSDGLECAAWRPPRPVAQCRQFQEDAKDSISECTWTLSALEVLRNALYKFKTYLLTYRSDMVDFVDFQRSRPCWIQVCRQTVPGLTLGLIAYTWPHLRCDVGLKEEKYFWKTVSVLQHCVPL